MRKALYLAAVALATSNSTVAQISFLGVPFGTDIATASKAAQDQGLRCLGKWEWDGTSIDRLLGIVPVPKNEWMATRCPCSGSLLDASASIELYFPFKPGKFMSGPTPNGGLEGAGIWLSPASETGDDLFARVTAILTEKYGEPTTTGEGDNQAILWVDETKNAVQLTKEVIPESRDSSRSRLGGVHLQITPAKTIVRVLYLSSDWYAKETASRDRSVSKAKGIF